MKAVINRILDIKLSSNYQYILGENLMENLRDHIGVRHDQKVFLLSDEIVWKLYGMKIDNSFSAHPSKVVSHIIEMGEDQKNFKNLNDILEKLAEEGFTKTDVLVAIGGGVIGDLGGLAAGLYMRGIDHVIVPTTTLAAVDSSVGGKTAINLDKGKNLAGMFKQPSRIVCDINCFETLNDRIFNEGLVEAVKIAYIYDYTLLNILTKDLRKDKGALYEVIAQAVKGKYSKIKNDEFDLGERLHLNYGHTLGHAIERLSNYQIRHGEAVGLGMLYMTRLSEDKGMLSGKLPTTRMKQSFGDISPSHLLQNILETLNLPHEFNYTYEELQEYLVLDKKNRMNTYDLIMLEAMGKAVVVKVDEDDLKGYLSL